MFQVLVAGHIHSLYFHAMLERESNQPGATPIQKRTTSNSQTQVYIYNYSLQLTRFIAAACHLHVAVPGIVTNSLSLLLSLLPCHWCITAHCYLCHFLCHCFVAALSLLLHGDIVLFRPQLTPDLTVTASSVTFAQNRIERELAEKLMT